MLMATNLDLFISQRFQEDNGMDFKSTILVRDIAGLLSQSNAKIAASCSCFSVYSPRAHDDVTLSLDHVDKSIIPAVFKFVF